ncbi:Hypothetical Protein FCC1311_029632 [Hondaea fermentalgiana]|uniref:SAP domain-containing protein n=1 Tax=Hondaea fermentalgiana TaxID=2315210 RepID=A0A2R5G6R2_9STRA|nr:Hypothetical Protein FCC1311_029632 [Hondaea fermentalgiana]|eukprot:GBG26742.1 Hypothetical Protein FCC1311_029632 [Hondaea fermentalgiana]
MTTTTATSATAAATPAKAASTPAASRRTPKPHATPRRVMESKATFNEQRIEEMTVKALQDALRSCQKAVSGRKAELQERLLDAVEGGASTPLPAPSPRASAAAKTPGPKSSSSSSSSTSSTSSTKATASKTKAGAAHVATPRRARPAKTPKASTSKKKRQGKQAEDGEDGQQQKSGPSENMRDLVLEDDGSVTWRGQDVLKLKVMELKDALRTLDLADSTIRLKSDLQDALVKNAKPRQGAAASTSSSDAGPKTDSATKNESKKKKKKKDQQQQQQQKQENQAKNTASAVLNNGEDEEMDGGNKAPTPFKPPASRRTGPRSSLGKSETDADGIVEPTPVRKPKSSSLRKTGPRRSLGAPDATENAAPEDEVISEDKKEEGEEEEEQHQQQQQPQEEEKEHGGPRSAKKIRPVAELAQQDLNDDIESGPQDDDEGLAGSTAGSMDDKRPDHSSDEEKEEAAEENGAEDQSEDEKPSVEDDKMEEDEGEEKEEEEKIEVDIPKVLLDVLHTWHVVDLQDAMRELELPLHSHEKKDELIEALGRHLVTGTESLTVADLKRYLHLIGGKVSGRKAELQARVARFLGGDITGTKLHEMQLQSDDESASVKKPKPSPRKKSPKKADARHLQREENADAIRQDEPKGTKEKRGPSTGPDRESGVVPPTPLMNGRVETLEYAVSETHVISGGKEKLVPSEELSASKQWTQAEADEIPAGTTNTPTKASTSQLLGAENDAEGFFTPVESEERPAGGTRPGEEEEEEMLESRSVMRKGEKDEAEVIPPTPAPADQALSGNWSDAAVPGSPAEALKEKVRAATSVSERANDKVDGDGNESGRGMIVPETPARTETPDPAKEIERLMDELQQDGITADDFKKFHGLLAQLVGDDGAKSGSKKRKSKSASKSKASSKKKKKLSSVKKSRKRSAENAEAAELLGDDEAGAGYDSEGRHERAINADGSVKKSKKKKSSTKKSSKKKKKRIKMSALDGDEDDGVIGIGSQSATARKLGRSQARDHYDSFRHTHHPSHKHQSVHLVDDSLDSVATPMVNATPHSESSRAHHNDDHGDRGDALFPGKPKWRESLLSNQSFEQHSLLDSSGHKIAPSPFANGKSRSVVAASPFTNGTPRRPGQYGAAPGLGGFGASSVSRARGGPVFPKFGSAVHMGTPAPAANGNFSHGPKAAAAVAGGGAPRSHHDPSAVAQRVLQSIDRESRELSRDALSQAHQAHSRFDGAGSHDSFYSSSTFARPAPRPAANGGGFAVPDTPPVKHLNVKRRPGSTVQPKFEFSPARAERGGFHASKPVATDESLEQSFPFPSLDD